MSKDIQIDRTVRSVPIAGCHHINHPALRLALKSRAFRNIRFFDPQGLFTQLREGPSSYAFCPQDNPDVVLKILKPDIAAKFRGLTCHAEKKRIHACTGLESVFYKTPRCLIAHDKPSFIVIEKLGEALSTHPLGSAHFVSHCGEIGQIVGWFGADLYKRSGYVHTDISCENLTLMEDSRLGIIDLAALQKVPAEHFLTCPAFISTQLMLHMAKTFHKKTGLTFDWDYIERFVLRHKNGHTNDASWCNKVDQMVFASRKVAEENTHIFRLGGKKPISTRCASSRLCPDQS